MPITTPPNFNDPIDSGYTYFNDPNNPSYPLYKGWNSYPFYFSVDVSGHIWSLDYNESAAGCYGESNTLCFFDSPADPYLPTGDAIDFITKLVGILPNFQLGTDCLALGTCVDLGVGFTWSDSFNGTSGGISVTASLLPVDPGSGTGGITITGFEGNVIIAVPEPPTWLLMVTGSFGVLLVFRFRGKYKDSTREKQSTAYL
ncbi:MAG TPA: hypothetical protein VMU13_03660 [Candidatus Paceibacterota bacterium]|nr:hypothetical protein [Candidatus Paceibacterota bacterium]